MNFKRRHVLVAEMATVQNCILSERRGSRFQHFMERACLVGVVRYIFGLPPDGDFAERLALKRAFLAVEDHLGVALVFFLKLELTAILGGQEWLGFLAERRRPFSL